MPAPPESSRGVNRPAQGQRATGRQTGKLAGNPGIFIGLEEHGDYVYARYEAIRGTWLSASLAERGYDRKYGSATAYGAYLGIAVDSNLQPLKNPDRIEPGLHYLIPVRKASRELPSSPPPTAAPPLPAPLSPPRSDRKAGPFSQGLERTGKDVAIFLFDEMAYPSFELNRDPPPPNREPRAAVKFWLQNRRAQILEGERRFHVSRIAIAGAIAWEALENPQAFSPKSVSVAKLHLEADPGDITWAEAIENAGKMPKLTLDERRELLQDPHRGILYVAATFDLICEEAEKYGFNLRSSPDILGHIYHSMPPKKWAARIKAKPKTDPFSLQPGGMGAWIGDNQTYLESAVGKSPIP